MLGVCGEGKVHFARVRVHIQFLDREEESVGIFVEADG